MSNKNELRGRIRKAARAAASLRGVIKKLERERDVNEKELREQVVRAGKVIELMTEEADTMHARVIKQAREMAAMRATIREMGVTKRMCKPDDNALAMAAACVEKSDIVLNGRLRGELIQCIAEVVHPLLANDPETVALEALLGSVQSEKVKLQEELAKAQETIADLCEGKDVNSNRTRALKIAAQCWCDETCESITMNTVLAEALADRIEPLLDMMDDAWGLIANANNGDWETAPCSWKDAAIRFRDKYTGTKQQ